MEGKIALITGATRGIGKSIAMKFAKNGINIILNGLDASKPDSVTLIEEIKGLGVEVDFFAADVSDFESVKKMMEQINEKFGKIDILVNNAGITKDRTLKKMSQEEWNSVINVNLNGVFNVTNLALSMIPEGGSIINLSSIVAMGGNFGQTNYAASKAGMIGFTKSLSKELGKKKIRVNSIAPGFIKSDMTDKMPIMMVDAILELIPMKEMGAAEDVANLAYFLATDDSKYITGQAIRIDGGLQM